MVRAAEDLRARGCPLSLTTRSRSRRDPSSGQGAPADQTSASECRTGDPSADHVADQNRRIRTHARHAPKASEEAAVIAIPPMARTDPTNSLVRKNGFVSIGYSRRGRVPHGLVTAIAVALRRAVTELLLRGILLLRMLVLCIRRHRCRRLMLSSHGFPHSGVLPVLVPLIVESAQARPPSCND